MMVSASRIEDNINMEVRDQWQVLSNPVINLQFPKILKILELLSDRRLLKDSAPWCAVR
jgi:hypothetical protein